RRLQLRPAPHGLASRLARRRGSRFRDRNVPPLARRDGVTMRRGDGAAGCGLTGVSPRRPGEVMAVNQAFASTVPGCFRCIRYASTIEITAEAMKPRKIGLPNSDPGPMATV